MRYGAVQNGHGGKDQPSRFSAPEEPSGRRVRYRRWRGPFVAEGSGVRDLGRSGAGPSRR